jgi:H+/Cl- antiporter ClcA
MSAANVLLKPEECAILPVDFQAGLGFGVESIPRQLVVNNAVGLARTAVVSYATRTPGGLFAPVLAVGAQSGTLFFALWAHFIPFLNATSQHFAIIGIAAFFASVVRAPLTGIILAVELTGSFALLLPMLAATFGAVTVASLAKCPPIYESLRDVR